jgi:twitching motility protein PilT
LNRLSDVWVSPQAPIAVEGVNPRVITPHVFAQAHWQELVDRAGFEGVPCDKNTTVKIANRRFRVNFFQVQGVPRASMRLLNDHIPTPTDLRIPKQIVEALLRYNDGIIVVAGSTGSGKSTTLASLLQAWAQEHSGHVVTLEDPIEYLLTGRDPLQFSQREVGKDVASFALGLSSAVRQAPKIIMVQEIRDPESAIAAISAAQTGHLVLTTLHTGKVKQSIQAILKLVPEGRLEGATFAFANCFRAIMCQRLVRSVAPNGKDLRRFAIHEVAMATRVISNHIVKGTFDLLENELITGRQSGHQTYELSIDNAIKDNVISPSAKKAIMDTI